MIGQLHQQQRSRELLTVLEMKKATVPAQVDEDLDLDNYGMHKPAVISRWLLKHPHVHVHFTPTGATWLSLVKRGFASLTAKQLRRGGHRSTQVLRAYIACTNEQPKFFVCTKAVHKALGSVVRFCHRTSDLGLRYR